MKKHVEPSALEIKGSVRMAVQKPTGAQPAPEERLKTSSYDRASSWILTLLVVVGLSVGVLGLAWWTARRQAPQTAAPVVRDEIGVGEGLAAEGPLLESPSMEQIQQEVDWPRQEIGPTLALLSQVAVRETHRWDHPAMERGGGGGTGQKGGGRGRAWEIRFDPGNTLESYAKQLDFFGIEFGVLLPDNELLYVAALSKAQPTVRRGPADQEPRYYFTWRQGELLKADRELLAKAGVDPKDRLILKFLPEQWFQRLAELEKAHAADKLPKVRKTRFGVRSAGDGYEFYVMEQIYK